MAGAMPGIGAISRIMYQRAEKRRRQAIEVSACFAQDVACDELGRILKHVDEAIELTQNLIGDMARGARFSMQENRNFLVAETDLINKLAQTIQRILRTFDELFIVNRQDKSRGTALLLRKRGQVAIAGDAQYFITFIFNGFGQHADSQAGGV